MANHALTDSFNHFFGRLNPSPTFEHTASEHYRSVKGLIEDRLGPARELSATCFLQGSYRNETATYTINDIDIVALCKLWDPIPPGCSYTRNYSRDEIFDIIAAPLRNDWRYRDKVRYGSQSMCIKLGTEPRVEILPVVYNSSNDNPVDEPFRLYRPENHRWENGFARDHKALISCKNAADKTVNNFVPAIKVLKHLRTQHSIRAVSFHIECLLYSLPNSLFQGGPADYIPNILSGIVATSASSWYGRYLPTPCEDRDIFTSTEWGRDDWEAFHRAAFDWSLWANIARYAENREVAVQYWRRLLGADFFPQYAS